MQVTAEFVNGDITAERGCQQTFGAGIRGCGLGQIDGQGQNTAADISGRA